ncbi:MAG: cupredoxin domain-containing protein [Pseudonocardiaceae bacterium]
MPVKPTLLAIAAAGMLVGLTGCAASDDPSGPEAPATSAPGAATSPEPAPDTSAAEPVAITITDFEYTVPDSVAPGAEITVTNDDGAAHTLTAKDKGDFDVTIDGDSAATVTAPSEPGSYPFFCSFHPNMTGTLVVE